MSGIHLYSLLSLLRTHLDHNQKEALLVIGVTAAAWAFPRWGSNWFHKTELGWSKLARSRRLAVLAVGLLALAARAAILPIQPIPQPMVEDEFSYLLAADTYAHGRLTNRTHPMWTHFEAYNILQKPTYMSKYYPAQGLIMAVGQVVAGHPFWGVWVSMGLMCAALCWMLQGWMPPVWALLGGLLAVIRLATFSYWGNSYYGGGVAAIGGALVLGALPRLRRTPQVRNTLLLGLGLAILANSRPYEGIFLGLGLAVVASVWLLGKKRPPLRVIVRRVMMPLLLVLVPTICAMGYYFWRVTGSPFRTPYAVCKKNYEPTPDFPWQSMEAATELSPPQLKAGYFEQAPLYKFAHEHTVQWAWQKAKSLVSFFLGPLLMMPVVALLLAHRGKFFRSLTQPSKPRLLLFLCALPLIGMTLPIWFLPHYAAPLTAAFYALVMLAMRHLRLWQYRNQPVGKQMVRVIPVLAVAVLVWQARILVLQRGPSAPSEDLGRFSVLAQLTGYSGGQLVVVRHKPDNIADLDWVYNDADIDAAKVVWARDMGTSANEELIRYFKDRRVWLLEADESPPKLLPYKSIQSKRNH